MNTYKIIFTRENGTEGSDNFTAPDEHQARRDFKECYRHGTGTIVSIELASTNTPATKQQERDTLEKIRKMVEQLGPDSTWPPPSRAASTWPLRTSTTTGPAPWLTAPATLRSASQIWRTSCPRP